MDQSNLGLCWYNHELSSQSPSMRIHKCKRENVHPSLFLLATRITLHARVLVSRHERHICIGWLRLDAVIYPSSVRHLYFTDVERNKTKGTGTVSISILLRTQPKHNPNTLLAPSRGNKVTIDTQISSYRVGGWIHHSPINHFPFVQKRGTSFLFTSTSITKV